MYGFFVPALFDPFCLLTEPALLKLLFVVGVSFDTLRGEEDTDEEEDLVEVADIFSVEEVPRSELLTEDAALKLGFEDLNALPAMVVRSGAPRTKVFPVFAEPAAAGFVVALRRVEPLGTVRGDPFDLVPVDEVDVEFDVDLASGAFVVPPAPRVTVEAVLELLTGFFDWLTLDTEEAPLAAESHRSEENECRES